jgi:hypothetical protein
MKKIVILTFILIVALVYACGEKFLTKEPLGVVSEPALQSAKGADALLIAAYSSLDGYSGWGNGGPWQGSATNWVFGSIAGGDAYKGSDPGDQPAITPIERMAGLPNNEYFETRWRVLYDGISRSNFALRAIKAAPDLNETNKKIRTAEGRFLRAHYHFELKKMWNMVPYVDENATDFKIPNDKDIYPQIEADLKFAVDNLPLRQSDVGRATKGAAQALLGKVFLFQKKFNEAKQQFDAVVASGVYSLAACYHDNFNPATKNGPESVFAVQSSVNDGSADNLNGNYGEILNYPYTGGPGGCCGFHQPSQNLVNAFQVDANGLPLLDTYNNTDVKNDQGVATNSPFTPHTGPLDPRLDWTVGRRGIPYLDWGPHPGQAWIRDQAFGGPYSPKKNVFYRSQQGTLSGASGWAQGANANNYNIIRYADVLLMLAEAEVELGNLERARALVNQVRNRAKSGCIVRNPDNTPAANYRVEPYNTPWTSKEFATKAVRFERRIELGMEGHRFFDLVRWGIAEQELNAYYAKEGTLRSYLQGARFTRGKNEYYPIPQQQIVLSTAGGQPTLKQNPGY